MNSVVALIDRNGNEEEIARCQFGDDAEVIVRSYETAKSSSHVVAYYVGVITGERSMIREYKPESR